MLHKITTLEQPDQTRPELTRMVEFIGAWDRTHPDPSKSFGVHGMELRFVLRGPDLAVQFLVFTNWHLRSVQERLDQHRSEQFPHPSCHPQPADLGYHSARPMYDDHEAITHKCEFLGGRPCYYDGSGLNAEDLYWKFVSNPACVWDELLTFYSSLENQEKS